MSLRRRRVEEEGSESINVSPLIDVVFILLIFFIVSATFVTVPGVEVKRPAAQTAKSLQKNSVLFALSERDEIFHAGKRVSLEEIPHLIEIEAKTDPSPSYSSRQMGRCLAHVQDCGKGAQKCPFDFDRHS